jgi:murein L,D-transpeptidase YcbB/YkuD
MTLLFFQAAVAAGQDIDRPALRRTLLDLIDSGWSHGLDSQSISTWRNELQMIDKPWTDIAFSFLKGLRSGYGIAELVSYDGISTMSETKEDRQLTESLAEIHTEKDLKALAASYIPQDATYDTLRAALVGISCNTSRGRQLAAALNLYRWIHHFHWSRCIIVNIANAELAYFEDDTVRLRMKIVAGEPSKRTPRLAAWCDQLTLYPYWNIPRKIAVNEFLPLFKVSPRLAEAMNIQIFDGKGKIMDPSKINWSKWNKVSFPYSMRQSTGCDNALGVVKFNITSPYDVYMHDTNLKVAFLRGYRWLSHGCIRLEKPVELGNILLNHRLDTTLLQSCLREQQPQTIRLEEPVPVFVIYQTAVIGKNGKLSLVKDIYHLVN